MIKDNEYCKGRVGCSGFPIRNNELLNLFFFDLEDLKPFSKVKRSHSFLKLSSWAR